MPRLRSKKKTGSQIRPAATPEERRRRTFQKATKLLAARSRSVAELRELLTQGGGANKTDVDEVLARLTEYGYLNDEHFALAYASAKVRQRPIGRQRLQRELALKRIKKEVADEALEQVFAETPEDELIDQAIAKRIRLRGRPTDRAEAKRLFDHLLRQGFLFELVAEKVKAVTRAADNDDMD